MTIYTAFIFFSIIALLAGLYFLPYKKFRKMFYKKIFNDISGLTKISYKCESFSAVFEKNGGVWSMTKPIKWQADISKIRKLVNKLLDMTVYNKISVKNPKSYPYKIGKNGVLRLIINNEETVIEFGGFSKSGENIFIMKSGLEEVLTVNALICQTLPKSEDDFKSLRIFEEDYSNIRSIEAVTKGRTFSFTKTETGWSVNGKNLFDEKIRPFIDKLLELKAEEILHKSIKLPPKHSGIITVKSLKRHISRYFFSLPEYENKYIIPAERVFFIVSKNDVKEVFGFYKH